MSTAIYSDLMGGPRAALATQGWTLIDGILPGSLLGEARVAILKVAADAGWVEDAAGRATSGLTVKDGDETFRRVYETIFRLEAVHELVHDARVRMCAETLLGADVIAHPKVVVRVIFPGVGTLPHRDYTTVRGSTGFLTFWMPLQVVGREFSGLSVASRSHQHHASQRKARDGIGGVETIMDRDAEWVCPAMAPGSALVFHSLTVHKADANKSCRVRLSVDFRYQRLAEPFNPGAFVFHDGRRWSDVYAEWKSAQHQYYWRGKNVRFSPSLGALGAERKAGLPGEADRRQRVLVEELVADKQDPSPHITTEVGSTRNKSALPKLEA